MRSSAVQAEGNQGAGHINGMRGTQEGRGMAEGRAGIGSPTEAGTPSQTVHNVPPLTLTFKTPIIKGTHSMPTQATLVAITRRVLAGGLLGCVWKRCLLCLEMSMFATRIRPCNRAYSDP
jgi:hypothetical protein